MLNNFIKKNKGKIAITGFSLFLLAALLNSLDLKTVEIKVLIWILGVGGIGMFGLASVANYFDFLYETPSDTQKVNKNKLDVKDVIFIILGSILFVSSSIYMVFVQAKFDVVATMICIVGLVLIGLTIKNR